MFVTHGIATNPCSLGEVRISDVGNVWRVDAIDGEWIDVRRIAVIEGGNRRVPYDASDLVRWHWRSLYACSRSPF